MLLYAQAATEIILAWWDLDSDAVKCCNTSRTHPWSTGYYSSVDILKDTQNK